MRNHGILYRNTNPCALYPDFNGERVQLASLYPALWHYGLQPARTPLSWFPKRGGLPFPPAGFPRQPGIYSLSLHVAGGFLTFNSSQRSNHLLAGQLLHGSKAPAWNKELPHTQGQAPCENRGSRHGTMPRGTELPCHAGTGARNG